MLVDPNICHCNSSAMVLVKVPVLLMAAARYPEECGSAELCFCTVPKVVRTVRNTNVFTASDLNRHNLGYHDGGLRLS